MTTYVAVLYSIILGQGRRLVMSDLKAMALDIGLANPRTLVATGNLVFEAPQQPSGTLESMLEDAFERRFGKRVDIIVRSASDWLALARGNPFPDESAESADQVAVKVMRSPVTEEAALALSALAARDEKMRVAGGDIWVFFSREKPSSRLLSVLSQRRIGIGTSRNWNTVRRLAEMVSE